MGDPTLDEGEQAVRDLHGRWVAAVNAGDLPSLLGWMADDVRLFGPGQALGRDDFPAGFLAAHQRWQVRCSSVLDEVVVAGALAHALSRDTLSLVPRAGGEPVHLAGHRMSLYRRQPDGRWLLARDLHTLAPVPA